MPSSMRCFKSFFKHTWHPQQMVIVPSPGSMWDYPCLDRLASTMGTEYAAGPDPEREFFPAKRHISEPHMDGPARFEPTKAEVQEAVETELGEVKVTMPTSSVATSTPAQPGSIPCRNGGCKTWRNRADPRHESPWHFLKTIFLISVIVALVIWVIVYTLLTQYQIV